MKSLKQLGIFMDHAHAHVIEYHGDHVDCKTVDKHSIQHGDHHSSEHAETRLNTKSKVEQNLFYAKLGEQIKNYDEVLLFGPTEAKVELLHQLRADHHFSHVKIEVKTADKLTENQQHAFVKDYFKK
ncbi:MAG: hypothetical protein IPG07_17080 [Crocinitomicaceae bacterium]|nr:hypothetical protein [Crocinitomicaceae bacterium]